MLQLRVDGYKWSSPFSVSSEGVIRIFLLKENGNDLMQLRVEVRSGTKNSRYEVLFRPNSLSSPYRSSSLLNFLTRISPHPPHWFACKAWNIWESRRAFAICLL